MVGDADLAGERDVAAEAAAARDPDLRARGSLSAPTLTEWPTWTRLSSLLPRPIRVSPSEARSIGGERADLDVVLDHDDADLRDLVVAALAVAREAEAVAPDHGAVLDDHPVAQPAALAHLDAGVEQAVLADHGVLVDDHVRVEHRARADPRPGADHGQCADVNAGPQDGARVHLGRRVDARRGPAGGRSSPTACANARYGLSETRRGRAVCWPGDTMTAEARVVAR